MGAVAGIPDLDCTFVVITRHFDLDLETLDLDGVVKDSKASPAFNFTEKLNI